MITQEDELYESAYELFKTGQTGRAASLCRELLQLQPRHAAALLLLGTLEHSGGNYREARRRFEELIALEKNLPYIWSSHGAACLALGEYDSARQSFETALQLAPGDADAWNNLGCVYENQGDSSNAEKFFRQALDLNPHMVSACNNLALACRNQRKYDDSILWLSKSLAIEPSQAESLIRLGEDLERLSDVDGACSAYKKALHIAGNNSVQVKMATVLPVIVQSRAEIHSVRDRLWNELERLAAQNVRIEKPWEYGRVLFYLTYHGLNDRSFHERLADLYRRSSPELTWEAPHLDRKHTHGERIKVGFISRFFYRHTIAKLIVGFLENLDRRRFHVTVLKISPGIVDDMTQRIAAAADRFVTLSGDIFTMREQIAACRLDILLYTDIGMEPMSYFLAFARLAPVQCVTWGHPTTSGIDTIDYFISQKDCETEASEAAYSEQLFCLSPAAAYTCYANPRITGSGKPLQAFHLAPDRNIYYCPQPPFKIHPDFDGILKGILDRDPKATIVLLKDHIPRMELLLRQRFQKTIPAQGERIHFLDPLPFADYIAMLENAPVVLDTVHFSGANSSLEGFAVGTPSVTLPSAYSKGRFTYAWYKRLGMDDCVARDVDDYVNIAVSIGTDAEKRDYLRRRIREANPALFDDLQSVRELEAFFEKVSTTP